MENLILKELQDEVYSWGYNLGGGINEETSIYHSTKELPEKMTGKIDGKFGLQDSVEIDREKIDTLLWYSGQVAGYKTLVDELIDSQNVQAADIRKVMQLITKLLKNSAAQNMSWYPNEAACKIISD